MTKFVHGCFLDLIMVLYAMFLWVYLLFDIYGFIIPIDR